MSLIEPLPMKAFRRVSAFVVKHRIYFILGLIILIAVLAVVFSRSCGKAKVQLDEKELQQVHEAIESRNRQEMEDAFVVIEKKQAEIDANVANAKANAVNAAHEARKKVRDMTDQELMNFLEENK